MIDNNNDKLNNLNIFNRSIFKKSTKEEIESSLKYFTSIEDYEKCIILKELLNIEYYVDDPIKDDVKQLNELIHNQSDILESLANISVEFKDNEDILNNIDEYADDIILNILQNDKLRKQYLQLLYETILEIDLPPINDKHLKLFKKYRQDSIDNIKKLLY